MATPHVPPAGGPDTAAAFLHPSADVEPDVSIGVGTRIWARTHVRRGAIIGSDCNIGEGVLVDLDVRVGDRCKIQSNALLYLGAEIEDEVFVGPAACLTNDRFPRAATPDGALKNVEDWTVSGVRLEEGCSVGAHAVVVGGVTVHSWAMVGAGAVVTRDVPPHALVVGNPARPAGWVCRCGARLDDALRCRCGRSYDTAGDGLREVGDT